MPTIGAGVVKSVQLVGALAGPSAIVAIMVFIRQAGIELVTRISGLLLSAIAVQLMVDAVREFARAGL